MSIHPSIFSTLSEVSRVNAPSPKAFARMQTKNHSPVILCDAIKEFPGLYDWSPEYLAARLGSREVPVEYSLRPVYRPNPKLRIHGSYYRKMMTLDTALDRILHRTPNQPWYYISTLSIDKFLPELEEELQVPYRLSSPKPVKSVLFLGGHGTGSHLHYDATENLLAVFRGAKEVLLIPPNETGKLYPYGIWNYASNFSSLDLSKLDQNLKSRVNTIRAKRCTVHPGEMLYIPSGWWHQVVNKGLTIGVTFVSPCRVQRLLTWQKMRILLSHRYIAKFANWRRIPPMYTNVKKKKSHGRHR